MVYMRNSLHRCVLAGVSALLMLVLLIVALTFPAMAEQNNPISGVGGDGLAWVIEEGVLTISGNGKMYSGYNKYGRQSPWYDYRELITEVVLEEGVASVGYGAFEDCVNIEEFYIPAGLTEIHLESFNGCTGLKSVWVHPNNENYYSDEAGALFNKEKTLLMLVPAMHSGSYNIPEEVEQINEYAFRDASHLTSIWLPSTIEECPDLSGCASLQQILVGKDHPVFSNDQQGALYNKNQTVLVTVPAGVSGMYVIRDGVIEVQGSAFDGCSAITALVLPVSLKVPGWFGGMEGLREIHISNLRNWCEYGGYLGDPDCKLYLDGKEISGELVIPEGTERIGFASFYGCDKITSIKFPSTLKVIDECAFADCIGLTELDIPASVEELVWQAFIGCTGLRKVSIGENVKKIPGTLFWDCNKLETVIFKGNAPEFAEDAFMGNTFTAYYPCGNPSWNAQVMAGYGGTVTWIPYYPVLSGENSKVATDTDKALSIRADADISKFVGVTVDDQTVDPANYTVTEGSTVVTLCAEYLRQLGEGEHEVKLIFTDAEAFTTLTIVDGVPGDMNEDKQVTDADAVYLLRHTLFPEDYPISQDGDVNCDGTVTDADAVYLLRHTLFPGDYPLFPTKQEN